MQLKPWNARLKFEVVNVKVFYLLLYSIALRTL